MSNSRRHFCSGVLLVFATYFYFLIFAQFAFLELARQNASASGLKVIMAGMAAGGLIGSFLVPLCLPHLSLRNLLRAGLSGCTATVFILWLPPSAIVLGAFSVGLFLSLVTVSLATSLPALFAFSWPMGTALGTGLAYAAANIPSVFQASPSHQAVAATISTGLAVFMVPTLENHAAPRSIAIRTRAVALVIFFFGILVWFDSAAFFVIQHSELKQGTWGNVGSLWRNAAVHFLTALATGLALSPKRFSTLLWVSFVLLGVSALGANNQAGRLVTGWLYPAGVSIYSACLVAFPAFGASAQSTQTTAWTAAILYALAGWICSGLGIGMAENLQRIPWQFVLAASIALMVPMLGTTFRRYRREISYAAVLTFFATAATLAFDRKSDPENLIAEGRAVYLSEGCINCHSQFVKPGQDELLWGPARSVADFATNAPPLFGNRRQGPDLLNVGNRRSAAWLKLHFLVPRALAPGSSMPSYKHLFRDTRGNALVAYLLSLHDQTVPRRTVADQTIPLAAISPNRGAHLFGQHCAFCHTPGKNRELLAEVGFHKTPPDLATGPFLFAPTNLPPDVRAQQLARLIKFGMPGTDMPGHEYLTDSDLFALVRYVEQVSDGK